MQCNEIRRQILNVKFNYDLFRIALLLRLEITFILSITRIPFGLAGGSPSEHVLNRPFFLFCRVTVKRVLRVGDWDGHSVLNLPRNLGKTVEGYLFIMWRNIHFFTQHFRYWTNESDRCILEIKGFVLEYRPVQTVRSSPSCSAAEEVLCSPQWTTVAHWNF